MAQVKQPSATNDGARALEALADIADAMNLPLSESVTVAQMRDHILKLVQTMSSETPQIAMNASPMVWKDEWENSDPEELGEQYVAWVHQLTAQGLHAKADIATVLAILSNRIKALASVPSATPCREDGNHRFEVSLNGKLYLRTHTIGEADILCRAILDGEMGLPSIYDHMRKTEVMLEQ